MSKYAYMRVLSIVLMLALLLGLSFTVLADTPAPNTTALPESTSSGVTTDGTTPVTTTMLDPNMTTTPDTADTMPDNDNTLDGDNKDEDGFNYTGLIIALVIAAAVIVLIVLLVPKNKNKT